MVKTASGATAVQVVWSSRRGSRNIEHIGSAHDETELEALKAAARERLAAGQSGARPRAWTGRGRAGRCRSPRRGWGTWSTPSSVPTACWAWRQAAGGDEVFRHLVLARIIEPASKLDSLRVLEEAGVARGVVSHRSSGACPPTRRRSGGSGCRRPAPRTPGSARPAWSFTTCPRCTSRPIRATGSASPGSPRSAAWSRRSPSGC